MTREEYIKKEQEITDQIAELSKKRHTIRQEYLSANLKIPTGTKVEVTISESKWQNRVIPSETHVGFVYGKKVGFGNAEYVLRQCKKDGTMSSRELYVKADDSNTKIMEG